MSIEAPETIVSTAGEKLTPAEGARNIASARNGEPKPKAPSAASKKAAKTQGDKPATQPKAAAPKPTPKPEPTEPSPNERKRLVGDALIDAAADAVNSWKAADHAGVSVLEASELMGSYCSFTPGGHWRPELAVPETGRGHKHQLDAKGQQARKAFVAKHTPKARSRKAA